MVSWYTAKKLGIGFRYIQLYAGDCRQV